MSTKSRLIQFIAIQFNNTRANKIYTSLLYSNDQNKTEPAKSRVQSCVLDAAASGKESFGRREQCALLVRATTCGRLRNKWHTMFELRSVSRWCVQLLNAHTEQLLRRPNTHIFIKSPTDSSLLNRRTEIIILMLRVMIMIKHNIK